MAFACEPGRGSEPGVGYSFVRAVAQHAQQSGRAVTVVTRPHRLQATREALADEGLAHLIQFLYVPVPRLLVRLTQRRRVRVAYLWWQAAAVSRVLKRIRERSEPAIVHHLTFATEALPTFEWRLSAMTARVFGPAGSGSSTDREGIFGQLRYATRQIVSGLNLKGVDLAIAQNDYAAARWAPFKSRVIVEPNIALSRERPSSAPKDGRHLVTSGVLTARKQQHLSIEALAKLPPDYRLTIVGGGPLGDQLKKLADSLDVSERVEFTGMLPRDAALRVVAGADVLLHTPCSEGAGWVVGEAQAMGVYPIVLKGSGADGIIKLGGIGASVDDVDGIVQAVLARPDGLTKPSDRWNRERLSGLLAEWYSSLDHVALSRLECYRSSRR